MEEGVSMNEPAWHSKAQEEASMRPEERSIRGRIKLTLVFFL